MLRFESAADARRAAVNFASELLRDAPEAIWERELRVQVSRDDGMILFTVIALGIESPAARV